MTLFRLVSLGITLTLLLPTPLYAGGGPVGMSAAEANARLASRSSQTLPQAAVTAAETKKDLKNLYVEHFFIPPELRVQYPTLETKSFIFVESPNRQHDTRYSIVTGFGKNILKSRYVKGLKDVSDIRKWINDNLETAEFEGVEIRRLPLPGKGDEENNFYWVGNKAYASADEARAEVALIQSITEAQGDDFAAMVRDAKKYIQEPAEEEPIEIKSPAQQKKEEETMLRFLDHLDIGNELYGPFQGETSGEPIIWQSFGETTWRDTNLDRKHFDNQVGYWTNRLVFKGIRFPLSTVDPYVELTVAMESNGKDYASHGDFIAGLEWRPFSRNAWLYNFRPWGIPLLEWVRSYRFYLQYMDRKNIKDEILGNRNHDFRAGLQIFYEWGIDLPPAYEKKPDSFVEFMRQNIWGEYFGDYRFHTTDFGTEDDYNAFILNSSVILGFRLPGIPLPENPINNELVLMPYMRFEHVNNTEFSFAYENQYFVAAGVRWMPFRTYRFKENEWLSKVKLFAEYVGVGAVQNAKQDGEAPGAIRHDLRFGVNISQRRF